MALEYAIQRVGFRLQAHGPRVGVCIIQRVGLGHHRENVRMNRSLAFRSSGSGTEN